MMDKEKLKIIVEAVAPVIGGLALWWLILNFGGSLLPKKPEAPVEPLKAPESHLQGWEGDSTPAPPWKPQQPHKKREKPTNLD